MTRRCLILCGLAFVLIVGAIPAGADDVTLLRAREGAAALLRGQYDKAVTAYNEALSNPEIADFVKSSIYSDRGVAKWRLKQTKEAVDDFNQSIQISPENASVYNNRGNALMDLGHPDEAVKDFDRAIALSPNYGAAYNNRGNAHAALSQYEPAFQDYRRAVELMPTSAVALNGRGKAHAALQRYHAAVRDYSRALALNTKYDAAYENRGEARLALEQYGGAAEDFTQVLATKPDQPDVLLLRATRLCRRQEIQHRGRGPQQGDHAQAGPRRRLYRTRRGVHAGPPAARCHRRFHPRHRARPAKPEGLRHACRGKDEGRAAEEARARVDRRQAGPGRRAADPNAAAPGAVASADPNAAVPGATPPIQMPRFLLSIRMPRFLRSIRIAVPPGATGRPTRLAPADPNAAAPADPNAAAVPPDPNAVPGTETAAADPNAAVAPADPNAAVPGAPTPADPNAPAAPADPNAVAAPADPNLPPADGWRRSECRSARDPNAAPGTEAAAPVVQPDDEALKDVQQALAIAPDDPVALRLRGDFYQATGKTAEAIADYQAALAKDPFQSESREALEKLGQEVPPEQGQPLGEPVADWVVTEPSPGRYVATNPKYKKLRAELEMFGAGKPKIIEWSQMKDSLAGIGLLRYAAGGLGEGTDQELVYTAVIDLYANKVVSIEPYSWGTNTAKWDWQAYSVVVTDPDGNTNELKLRKPRTRPVAREGGGFFEGPWGGPAGAGQPQGRRRGGAEEAAAAEVAAAALRLVPLEQPSPRDPSRSGNDAEVMTLFLASVRDVAEAETALLAGADIIDLKDPAQGALGAVDLETTRSRRGL